LLLQHVATGNPEAIRQCVTQYGGLVWSLARRFSPNAQDAEDAVQEVFLDLWRSASRFDPTISSETTFVATIARRRLIDRRRQSRRRPEVQPISEAPSVSGGEHEQIELCGEAVLAAKALAQLRPEHRTVLIMATYHGLSHDEIAQSTGLPLGTVKAHARRGLMRLRELLGGSAPEAESYS
jgi:RNA polymerase sigma factor (sigma-70 family)